MDRRRGQPRCYPASRLQTPEADPVQQNLRSAQCGPSGARSRPPRPLWRARLHLGARLRSHPFRYQRVALALHPKERNRRSDRELRHVFRRRPQVFPQRPVRLLPSRRQSLHSAARRLSAPARPYEYARRHPPERRRGLGLPRRARCPQQLLLVAGLKANRLPADERGQRPAVPARGLDPDPRQH